MRKIAFWLILFLLMATILTLTASLALAELNPFHPGDALFSLQQDAEQALVNLTPDPTARAETLLDFLSRRIADLDREPSQPSLAGFDHALDEALLALSSAPEKNSADLRTHALAAFTRARDLLLHLYGAHPELDPSLAHRRLRIELYLEILSDLAHPLSDLTAQPAGQGADNDQANSALVSGMGHASIEANSVDPHVVAFQPGSGGAQHKFFPLTGKHAAVECSACHAGGQYAGTPAACSACHSEKTPAGHYPGECALCHSADGWKPAQFDHPTALIANCATCHQKDKPASHFDGQCSLCHATNAWKPAHFDHALPIAANCQSCHAVNKPTNHYNGQCSLCHTTRSWKPASFNHAAVGATDCVSCHSGKKPANHYSGQCSLCHYTKAWRPASFNHAAMKATDCISCHLSKKPANHYNGQCSSCHSTNAWKPANFNHAVAGATDCQSCHAGKKPANHFAGQCSLCHNTSAWKPANFNHAAVGATDCQSCHAGKKPANHFAGQCSLCHTTTAWKPANFNHSFPMSHGGANGRCAACHENNGAGSPNCFLCHNQAELDKKHAAISKYQTRCLSCHPGGKGD